MPSGIPTNLKGRTRRLAAKVPNVDICTIEVRCNWPIELAELIGTEVEGGYLVRRKDVQDYQRDLKQRINQAQRLAGKRVVKVGEAVVTAYHATRSKQRRLLRRR